MYRSTLAFFCFLLGHLLRWVRINRVPKPFPDRSQPESDWIVKTRKWYAEFPRWIGNLFFRFRHPSISVLPTAEWINWEQRLENGIVASGSAADPGHTLRLARLKGTTLARLLQLEHLEDWPDPVAGSAKNIHSGPKTLEDLKLNSVRWAAKGLYQFHQRALEGPVPNRSWDSRSLPNPQADLKQTPTVLLSHADATVTNVMVDWQEQRAVWFDFDLRHDLTTAAELRQADDLRAFLYSAAISSPWRDLEEVLQVVQEEYPKPAVWRALRNQVADDQLQLDWFHWSQLVRCQGRYWKNAPLLTQILLVSVGKPPATF
jgi:hypothetical protein